jgi:hypothetical protein
VSGRGPATVSSHSLSRRPIPPSPVVITEGRSGAQSTSLPFPSLLPKLPDLSGGASEKKV